MDTDTKHLPIGLFTALVLVKALALLSSVSICVYLWFPFFNRRI